MLQRVLICIFFVNDTATTEIYTLSLHDALPIWSNGPSLDGRSEFRTVPAEPTGGEPELSTPPKESYAQLEQMAGGPGQSDQLGSPRPSQKGGGAMEKVKEALT